MTILDVLLDARLSEAFAAPPAPTGETPGQSMAIATKQVATAKQQLAAGWNAAKHPRAGGGKFGYTTGGARARKGRSATRSKGSAKTPRTLNLGAKGALVSSIQKQLGVPVSGSYDNATKAAVTRYQQQHGLQVDGVVGRQTLAALRGHTNPAAVAPGPIASATANVRVHPANRSTKAVRAPQSKVKAGSTPTGAPSRTMGGVVV